MGNSRAGSIKVFQSTPNLEVLENLISFHRRHYEEGNDRLQPQIRAWNDCISFLNEALRGYAYPNDFIIFEYVIPRSGLCRPDVILIQVRDSDSLGGDTDENQTTPDKLLQIKVIEFKSHTRLELHEQYQISDYVRKLTNYHEFCHKHVASLEGILVSTHPQCININKTNDDPEIRIVGHHHFINILNKNNVLPAEELRKLPELKEQNDTPITSNVLQSFINSPYKPSPAIVHTARGLYLERQVPRISTVESSNFYQVLDHVKNLIQQAQKSKTHHLIMVHGEPGSGKTFLGLEIAHRDYSQHQNPGDAIFLSGNKPLVDVLSALTNDTFVQLLSNFKRAYKYIPHKEAPTPKENIIIFDEAQRAWDAGKMSSNISEPDVILEIATRPAHDWSVVIALIGHGQEIKGGEEAGLILWAQAVDKVSRYRNMPIYVHGATTNIDTFKHIPPSSLILDNDAKLYLDSALRNHDADRYHDFINSFLAGDFGQAKLHYQSIRNKYLFRWTEDIEAAKGFLHNYAQNIHYNDGRFQYGALRSSTARNSSYFKEFDYNKKAIASPGDAVMNYVLYHAYRELNINDKFKDYADFYSNALIYAANEYQCQGLELDMALVEWGNDLVYGIANTSDEHQRWYCPFQSKKHNDKHAHNPDNLITNTYRVLLTRGRDATIIVTKDQTLQRLLTECGVQSL